MITIAFGQQKGGVGKTTLAIHTAVRLHELKKSVAIVDMDPQGTASMWAKRRGKDEPFVVTSDLVKLPGTLVDLKDRGIDIALLDLPGQKSPLANDGMKHADLVVLPTRPFDVDLQAAIETVKAAIRMNRPYVFVINSAPAQGKRTKDFVDELKDSNQPVLATIIVERFAFPDAIKKGLGVTEFEPVGKAAAEIRSFTSEVLKRMQ